MAVAFNALTPEQQATWYAWENQLRSLAGEAGRLLAKMDILNQAYNAQIQGILVALTDNSIVPNTSNLVGSQSLDSDAEAVTIMAHFQGMLTTYYDVGHRQMWTKATGARNMLP